MSTDTVQFITDMAQNFAILCAMIIGIIAIKRADRSGN